MRCLIKNRSAMRCLSIFYCAVFICCVFGCFEKTHGSLSECAAVRDCLDNDDGECAIESVKKVGREDTGTASAAMRSPKECAYYIGRYYLEKNDSENALKWLKYARKYSSPESRLLIDILYAMLLTDPSASDDPESDFRRIQRAAPEKADMLKSRIETRYQKKLQVYIQNPLNTPCPEMDDFHLKLFDSRPPPLNEICDDVRKLEFLEKGFADKKTPERADHANQIVDLLERLAKWSGSEGIIAEKLESYREAKFDNKVNDIKTTCENADSSMDFSKCLEVAHQLKAETDPQKRKKQHLVKTFKDQYRDHIIGRIQESYDQQRGAFKQQTIQSAVSGLSQYFSKLRNIGMIGDTGSLSGEDMRIAPIQDLAHFLNTLPNKSGSDIRILNTLIASLDKEDRKKLKAVINGAMAELKKENGRERQPQKLSATEQLVDDFTSLIQNIENDKQLISGKTFKERFPWFDNKNCTNPAADFNTINTCIGILSSKISAKISEDPGLSQAGKDKLGFELFYPHFSNLRKEQGDINNHIQNLCLAYGFADTEDQKMVIKNDLYSAHQMWKNWKGGYRPDISATTKQYLHRNGLLSWFNSLGKDEKKSIKRRYSVEELWETARSFGVCRGEASPLEQRRIYRFFGRKVLPEAMQADDEKQFGEYYGIFVLLRPCLEENRKMGVRKEFDMIMKKFY